MPEQNPFDRFDENPTSTSGGNPFDRFDPETTDTPPKPAGLERYTSAIREYTDPAPFMKGAAKGIVGMGVGVGQRLSNLPGTESIAQSAPAQAVKNWALSPSESWKETAGRIVGPVYATGPLSAGMRALPYVGPAAQWAASKVPAWLAGPGTAASAIRGATTGAATAAATTPTQSGEVSIPATLLGAGLGGGAAAVGRSPISRIMQGLGIRQTPGRMIPGGRGVESMLRRVPVAKDIIGIGEKTMRDDAQRAAYNYAYEPVGIRIDRSHPVGEKGLDRVRDIIGGRINNAAGQGTFPNTSGLQSDLRAVQQSNHIFLNQDQRDRLSNIIDSEVNSRFSGTSGILPGSLLVGDTGIMSRLSNIATRLAKSDPGLAKAVRDVRETVLDNISFRNPAAKQWLTNARKGYARYSDLERAARGDRAGFVGPSRILARDRTGANRTHPDLRNLAQQMREGGVPDIGKGGEVVGHNWSDALGVGALPALYFHPGPTLAAGSSALAYTPAAMSFLEWMARQNPSSLGVLAGTAASSERSRQ